MREDHENSQPVNESSSPWYVPGSDAFDNRGRAQITGRFTFTNGNANDGTSNTRVTGLLPAVLEVFEPQTGKTIFAVSATPASDPPGRR